MEWSPQQDRALCSIKAWLKAIKEGVSYAPIFRLFGFAGTGKTTLIQYLVDDFGLKTTYCAFTGKAASVMRLAGCENATTLHSAMYLPFPKQLSEAELARIRDRFQKEKLISAWDRECLKHAFVQSHVEPMEAIAAFLEIPQALAQAIFFANKDRDLRWIRKDTFGGKKENGEEDDQPVRLIVVDECSMVGRQLGEDLLSFGIPVLVIGDPAQLPPIDNGGFLTDAEPDIMLTEIHRQAKDNPIIRLSMFIREGGLLSAGSIGESRIIYGNQLDSFDWTPEVQTLVGTNKRRREYNKRIRRYLGFTQPHPEEKDKLVCTQNVHDLGLLNGSLWNVLSAQPIGTFRTHHGKELPVLPLLVESLDEPGTRPKPVMLDPAFFATGEETESVFSPHYQDFTYGYALTTHKAQGSQWNDVLLFDESRVFRRGGADIPARWLYTGVTRAIDRVTVVL
jgi:exodeoxyribonuclease-5